MGTRAQVNFIDEEGEIVASVYHQMDGYPEGPHGVGFQLCEWLQGYDVVNGMPVDPPKHLANGVGCLAAQYIAHVKKAPGGVYMIQDGSWYVDYTYSVVAEAWEPIKVGVTHGDDALMFGNLDMVLEMIAGMG